MGVAVWQDMLRNLRGAGVYVAIFVGSFVCTLLIALIAFCYVAYRSGVVSCALAVCLIGVFSWLLRLASR